MGFSFKFGACIMFGVEWLWGYVCMYFIFLGIYVCFGLDAIVWILYWVLHLYIYTYGSAFDYALNGFEFTLARFVWLITSF
jgi:hypothetical protein